MMKRKGFILAEILTGMMIQAWFIVALCGAFYLLLTFSTRIQQSNAAQDHGQRVIAYVDARIRNAGLGLWGCGDPATPESIFAVLNQSGNYMPRLKNLHLPVAITSRDVDNFGPYARPADGIYSGDVLTLLYAHRDFNTGNKLIIDLSSIVSLDAGQHGNFHLITSIAGNKAFFPGTDFTDTPMTNDIKSYGVIENLGLPVYLSNANGLSTKEYVHVKNIFSQEIYVHPLSELLPLECERMYVTESKGQRSFMIKSLGVDSGANAWNPASPHTAGILEIYMELNVSPDITPKMPIFTLKVLVNEGKSDTPTQKPSNWPRRYWKTEYAKYKVHVSQASWKLPNLAPITY